MRTLPHNILERFLSSDRLGSYIRMADDDHARAVALYLKNLEECQRFYGGLHWLEIGLRNAINRELSFKYGPLWFDNPHTGLEDLEQQQVDKVRETLRRNGKATGNGDMVAALNFGFWVNLFNHPYENLWRVCLRRAFPGRTTALSRKELRKHVHPLLRLRNRIAHYEPILEYDLPKCWQNVEDLVRWIEPGMKELP